MVARRGGRRRSSPCECRSPQLCIPAELTGTHTGRSLVPASRLVVESQRKKLPRACCPQFFLFVSLFIRSSVEWLTFRPRAAWSVREGGYYRCKVRITLDNSHFTGSLSLNRKTGNFTTQPKSLSLCLSLSFSFLHVYIYIYSFFTYYSASFS